MIYTITALVLSPNAAFTESRCFGYFPKIEETVKPIEHNYMDMHECLYDALVVEEVKHGIHPTAKVVNFYLWIEDKWVLSNFPESLKGYSNFSLG